MPKVQIKQKSQLSRPQVSERLISLGRALATGSEVDLRSDGDSISVVVADQLRSELEIEVDGDQGEKKARRGRSALARRRLIYSQHPVPPLSPDVDLSARLCHDAHSGTRRFDMTRNRIE
ncbi:amphi-Trp domain-containing protein [Rhodococcus sp. C26F]